MVAHDDRGPGFEHLVRHLHVLGPRSGRVLGAPVNGNYQQIALGARLFHSLQHSGFVHSRSAARLIRIGEEVHVRLAVFLRVAIAIEPAGHAQPAHLDAVGLRDHRLPGLRGRVT